MLHCRQFRRRELARKLTALALRLGYPFGLGPQNEFLGGYDPPRQFESDFTNRPDGADVICGAPDDLHYELEPMLESENEMETCVR